MSVLEFDQDEKDRLVPKLKRYMSEELDHDIGGFEAEFFLDFILQELGATFYNKGLHDAQQAMLERIETINDAIYDLEKPL